jgi:hypothetical protein
MAGNYYSFEMIFPNKLKECCEINESEDKKSKEENKKKHDDSILKNL